jgi:hypothetical protein
MATISNVVLQVQKGGEGSRRLVTVTYKLCFSACEALAGSTFVETVLLRGDDPIFDDNLITLSRRCVKATDKCQDRKTAVNVSRSTLDEDGDTIIIIFGQVILRIADRDELYARITLTPFAPSGSTADSNIVTGQWGAAGNN